MRSQTIGFRLCGIADEPFWPTANGSSASRTSLRCRWRISTAKRSRPPASTASVASKRRVAIARDDLGRGGLDVEPEALEGDRLDARVDVPVGADGAGELAHGDAAQGIGEPLPVAVELEPPAEQLESERRRLGVHAVRATHARRVAVLLGTDADDVERAVDAGEQQLARLAQDEGQRGVDDVGGRQPVVEPARLRPDLLGHRLGEREHVVVGAPLDLARPVDVDARASANGLDRLGRDDAELAPGVERGELDLEPRLQPSLVAPQRAEGRPGVAVDHGCSLRVGLGRAGRGVNRAARARPIPARGSWPRRSPRCASR